MMDRNSHTKLSKVEGELTPSMLELVMSAKALYKAKLAPLVDGHHQPPAYIVAAPGRVNLIGEHTDYTGGFVLPLAIEQSTVCYGTGFCHTGTTGSAPTSVRIRLISQQQPKGLPSGDDDDAPAAEDGELVVEERKLVLTNQKTSVEPPDESEPRSWTNYVQGVVAQYLPDLPTEGCTMDLAMAFASNVPVGAGLSSSAALEVATAMFLECVMHDRAYSSADLSTTNPTMMEMNNASIAEFGNMSHSQFSVSEHPDDLTEDDIEAALLDERRAKERALRCQKAEHEWAFSPCGIMDQLISSAAKDGHLMLIDCRDLQLNHVVMRKARASESDGDRPVILITNSNVQHEIADGEYGLRRGQCNEALEAMQQVPLYHVLSLRDANVRDVETAKAKMDDELVYNRAQHVVTENQRTKECKTALKLGLWDRVGELMNASHASLRDHFEVSCEEVDFLVETSQEYTTAVENGDAEDAEDGENGGKKEEKAVYGSRMTGGGFGGCSVTLVKKKHVAGLVAKLKAAYAEKFPDQKPCDCFVTQPGPGARVLAIDVDCCDKK